MEAAQSKERSGKSSQGQIALLVDYMTTHTEFALGNCQGPQGKAAYMAMWEALSLQLNSVGGPQKTVAKWQECWKNLRSQARKKSAEIRRAMAATGNVKAVPVLSPNEEKIMALVGEVSGAGGTGIGSIGARLDAPAPVPVPMPSQDDPSSLLPDALFLCETEEIIDEPSECSPVDPSPVASTSEELQEIISETPREKKRTLTASGISQKKKRKQIAGLPPGPDMAALVQSQLKMETLLATLTDSTAAIATQLTKLTDSTARELTKLTDSTTAIASALTTIAEIASNFLPSPAPSPPLPPPPSPW